MEQKNLALSTPLRKILDSLDTLIVIVEVTYMKIKVPMGTHFILEHVWFHGHEGSNP
jgi:hypothetical protein